jgi:hypothetical protein
VAARGYDADEVARLQAVFTEITGGAAIPRINSAQLGGFYNPDTSYDFEVKNYDETQFESEEEYLDYLNSSSGQGPAMLTDIPTSSTNAARPRTVAAGYQPYFQARSSGAPKSEYGQPLGKMTVMFRDGTLYNYYDVTPGEWQTFSASVSKGAPWLNKGFPNGKQQVDGYFIGKPQGPADLSQAPASVLKNIYKIARTAQVRFASPRRTSVRMSTPEGATYRKTFNNVVTRAGAKRAQLSPRSKTSRGLGTNPAKNAGSNPYKNK